MRLKIFFVHSGNERFVKLDLEILRGFSDVHEFYAIHKFPFDFSQYCRGVRRSDLVFCWFASWNSFWTLLLAKLFQRRSVLVIGGYDLAKLPRANYGHQRGGLMKWVSRLAMSLADELFTNSYYSQNEAEQNAGISAKRVKVIYHGLPDPFSALSHSPKERMALTVGKVDWPNLQRKGLETFVRAAKYLSNVQFAVLGTWEDDAIEYLRSIASPNVLFTGWVSDEVLLDYYRRSSVYVQTSLHEGFGLSVAEAMLAGCVPVVTRHGSLPEVVGDCGLYVASQEPQTIARTIETALDGSASAGEGARRRILSLFSVDQRRELLKQVVLSRSSCKSAAN